MRIRIKALALACTLALPFLHQPARAQADPAAGWPARPVTLVVPFPPGGASDVVGRQLAVQLGELLGNTFIIENKAGAATAIGAVAVARAPKDGYTLLLSSGSTFTTTPHLIEKVGYKLDDFAPVAAVATVPFAFVVKKDFPARNVQEFVAYGRANPGKINNATNGQGSMVHLLGELVGNGLEVKMTQVHYKGAAPATMDMIGGVVDSNVEALSSALPNLAAGKYRALAVLSAERQALLPDVPTFRELGYPNVVGETWYAVFAPAGTPQAVIDKLNTALNRVTGSPRFGEAMRKIGNEPRSGTPEALLQVTRKESASWRELIRRLNISAE
jgi:tripartite-type tricarboxylate transporter receptor subunit TctC